MLLKQLTTMEKKENKKRGRKRRKGGREMRGMWAWLVCAAKNRNVQVLQ